MNRRRYLSWFLQRVAARRSAGAALAVLLFAGLAALGLNAAGSADVSGPISAEQAPRANAGGTAKIVLAGGCFWGMEAVFESLKGVTGAVSGYSGGSRATAHYEVVSTGLTGHAESVEISYDPSRISFNQLLRVYFLVAHDPTELNRQGPDEGRQYRSVIFYTTDEQRREAAAYIRHLESARVYDKPIVTQLVPFEAFYPAEAYHQHFMARNPDYPYIVVNDRPKLEALRQRFPDLVSTAKT